MSLNGMKILVTRPQPQADACCARIRAAGGQPLCWPLIDIAPPQDEAGLTQALTRLPECQWAIFSSAAAVEYGWRYVQAQLGQWPQTVQIAAIGTATARALTAASLPVSLTPLRGYTSEALLAEAALQRVRGQWIALFQGEGGRELIAEVLAQREARVLAMRVYRRLAAELHADRLLTLWQRGGVEAVTVTSTEIFDHLRTLLVGHPDYWRNTPLIVISPRLAEYVRQAGAQQVLLADSPEDDALVLALEKHLHQRQVDDGS